jgi:hypothetical protein
MNIELYASSIAVKQYISLYKHSNEQNLYDIGIDTWTLNYYYY